MSKSYVEIDFFPREKWNSAPSKPSSPESVSSPFRAPAGIQGVVSRINPQLPKMVMATEHARSPDNIAEWPTSSSPPFPSRTASSPALPIYNPASRCSISPSTGTAPLTILYNGTVTIFDVHHDLAEIMMRMAEMDIVGNPAERPENSAPESNQVVGDLPIARRKSLQRFLEKRRERLASASPYINNTTTGTSPPVTAKTCAV